MSFTLRDLLGILIIYQALVFAASLFFIKIDKPSFIKILLYTFLIMIGHFGYMLVEHAALLKGIILGPFFGLVYGPLMFAYTKSLIVKDTSPGKYSIHFLPALISLTIIFFMGGKLTEGIGLLNVIIPIHFSTYLFVILLLIYRYRKQLLDTTSSFNRISLSWLEIIVYLQLATMAVVILEGYFQANADAEFLIIVIYLLALVLIHCFYHLGLKQVTLFQGLAEEPASAVNSKEYAIADEKFTDYLSRLESFMTHEKPYLEFELSLQDLSAKLSISPRNLSHIINRQYKMNFYSFINHHRIERAKQDLQETGKPIKEIMYDSGFSNKATFYSIFKKNTGLTPDQYRKRPKN